MRQMLTSAGFCQAHQVFNLKEMVEFGRLFGRQAAIFLAADQVLNALFRCFGRLECRDATGRSAGGNEIHKFFVGKGHNFTSLNAGTKTPLSSAAPNAHLPTPCACPGSWPRIPTPSSCPPPSASATPWKDTDCSRFPSPMFSPLADGPRGSSASVVSG